MLRLWPDVQLLGLTRILVLADRVLAEHYAPGIRPKKVHAHCMLKSGDSLALKTALTTVLSQLPNTMWQRTELYFADHHVQWMMLPAINTSSNLPYLSSQEHLAYARAWLIKTFGEIASQWPFRMQDTGQHRPLLLATIPALSQVSTKALLQPIKSLTLSVQPYLGVLCAQSPLPENGTVIIAESTMLRFLQFKNGHVDHVSSIAFQGVSLEVVGAWVLRERILLDAESTVCYWLNEPASEYQSDIGRQLTQHLQSKLSIKPIYSTKQVTSLWKKGIHVA